MNELQKRREQVQVFIRQANQFKAERDAALQQNKRLRQCLEDIAFAPPEQARELARRALAKIERAAAKEVA